MDDDPDTDELRAAQDERERAERERADEAGRTGEIPAVHTHERRADRAAYLRDKLDERARSERDEPERE